MQTIKGMIMIIDNKLIDKTIIEEIERFLNEELSVNAEVVDVTNKITNTVYKKHLARDKYNGTDTFITGGVKYVIPYYFYTEKADFTHKVDMVIYCKIYDVTDYGAYDKLWDKMNLGGISNENYINVTCISVGKKIHKSLFSQILSHELEHCFQLNKSQKKNNNELYVKAANIVNGTDKIHNNELFTSCAYCIYALSKKEVDANINGIYNELIGYKEQFKGAKIANILKNSTAYNTYNDIVKSSLSKIMADINSPEIGGVVSYFGFTLESFSSWVDKQMDYLSSKLRKVAQKLYNDINSDFEIKPDNTLRVKPVIF